MKALFAVSVFLLTACLLGWGILLAFRGQIWLLIAAFAAYLLALGFIGCRPQNSH